MKTPKFITGFFFFLAFFLSGTLVQAQCVSETVGQCDVCPVHEVCTNVGSMLGGFACTVQIGQCGATESNTCNASTKNQCGVCPSATEYCNEVFIGGAAYRCEEVIGQCGLNDANTCNSTTLGSCSVCTDNQVCQEHIQMGGAKTYSCDSVPGTCGATDENSCNNKTVNKCDVCPNGQRCVQTGAGPNSQECKKDDSCINTTDPVEDKSPLLCQQAGVADNPQRIACEACAEKQGVWTAVGCIPYKDTTSLVRAIISLGLGIAGTVVVMMTLAGAFLMSTSRGEPQRVDEAKSLITSAIAGIFFIIFSVTILQFIGVRILQIPGFG